MTTEIHVKVLRYFLAKKHTNEILFVLDVDDESPE
jgi:hypothetical protein